MRSSRGLLGVVLLGMVSVAATRFVAMRVEMEPLRPEGEVTAVALVVQVAPEDRARIGRSAWLDGEIRRGGAVVARLARAAELDASGSVRLEMTLEPGTYEVRVELRSGTGRDAGIWEGEQVVPRLERQPEPSAPRATPEPAPPAAPGPEPAAPEVAEPDSEAAGAPAEAAAALQPTEPASPPQVREATEAAPPPAVPPVARTEEPLPAVGGAEVWGSGRGDLTNLTVVVTDRDRPVLGLGARDLRVEIGGDLVTVEEFGGSGDAPLLLGVAVDASRSMAEEMDEVRGLVGRLSLRASGGRGMVSLVRADGGARVAVEWGAQPENVAAALAEAGAEDRTNLAELLIAGLSGFGDRAGRRVLLVVVDGGDSASRSDWKAAVEAAESAGIPVLVLGFKGDELDDRTRSYLERVSELSGGADYWLTLRDTGLLSLVGEHFGDLLDASYAVRFRRSPSGEAEKVDVTPLARNLDVRHSRRLR